MITLTHDDIAAIAKATAAELRATMTTIQQPIQAELVGTKEAMVLLGCKSASALHRRRRRLKIHAVSPGQFRRKDIINAIARASLEAGKA